MANERVIRETVITPQLAIGDREPNTTINFDLEVKKDSGDAQVGIITGPSDSGTISFNDGTSNVAVIEFNQSTEEFIVSINSNPAITISASQTTVHENLTVKGTTTTVNSAEVEISDRIFLLNKDEAGPGVTFNTAGIEIERGPSDDNAGWFFNELQNWWGPTGPSGSLEPGVGVTQALGNIGTIDSKTANDILTLEGMGAVRVHVGTTGERPGSPVAGMLRFNTTETELEVFDGTDWDTILASPGGSGDFVNTSGDTMTGDLLMDTGAQILGDNSAPASAPAYAFEGVANAGVFLASGNTVGISQNNSQVIKFATDTNGGIIADANLDLGGHILRNTADPTAGDEIGDRDFNDGRYLRVDGSNDIQGNIEPDMNSVYDFGAPSQRFSTIYADTFDGTATMALYSDLAERYAADATYEPGTVLVFGGEAEVTAANQYEDTAVAGIVSTKPGFMLNKDVGPDDTHPYIALKGRVPCKVIGRVKKGDLLITSGTSGHAISTSNPKPYTVIGKAIQDHNPDESDGKGIVEVFVL